MEEKEKTRKKLSRKQKKYAAIAVVVIIIIIVVCAPLLVKKVFFKPKPEIISKAALEEIINVSELSTFQAVYNGIAKVMNEEDPEKIDYYVSYNAKVKAGIDFEEVEIAVDNEQKIITITLPEIKIIDTDVDITSLDYIFENKKADTPAVSEQAYKKCIEDVKTESSNEKAIYELAKQNAENIVEALVKPFVKQVDEDYRLEIN